MNDEEVRMHLAAGRYYGRMATCGRKQVHLSEEAARKAAASLNDSGKAHHAVEAYPCYFCPERFPDQLNDFVFLNWHIGREMDESERELFTGSATALLDMEDVILNAAESSLGIQLGEVPLRVHNRKLCEGRSCCIHNPSDHHMKTWPVNWRGDRGIMERMCTHYNADGTIDYQIGHIDPDDSAFRKQRDGDDYDSGVHGCDGCCRAPR